MATKPIFAWSHSTLQMFENCPRKFYAVKIRKINDNNYNNMQGDAEHQNIERYLKFADSSALLPRQIPQTEIWTGDLSNMVPVLDRFRAAPGERYYEYQMTLDNDFVPCKWKDWNRAWVRGAADLLIVAGNIGIYTDWKSGKFKKDDEQIETTALLAFKHFPQMTELRGTLYYYRQPPGKVMHRRTVTRTEEAPLWADRMRRVKAIELAIQTQNFPANPNPLCGYCPDGTCPHNRNADAVR